MTEDGKTERGRRDRDMASESTDAKRALIGFQLSQLFVSSPQITLLLLLPQELEWGTYGGTTRGEKGVPTYELGLG